jgi:hypothetical protein
MSQKEGIKELKEVLDAVLSTDGLTGLFIKCFKDGAQASDAAIIFSDLMSNPKYMKAIQDINKIGVEVKDLDMNESFDLATDMLKYIKDIVALATQK